MDSEKLKNLVDCVVKELAQYASAEEGDDEAVRSWFVAAVFRIWSANKYHSRDYIKALEIFGNSTYTMEHVISGMKCVEEQELKVPGFFSNLVLRDVIGETNFSRQLVQPIGDLLIQAAIINGDFTVEEAEEFKRILDMLHAYCDKYKIEDNVERNYYENIVTPINWDSYEEFQGGSANLAAQIEEIMPTKEAEKESEKETKSEEKDNEDLSEKETQQEVTSKERKERLEEVMAELHELIGLEHVKNDVQSLLNLLKICRMREERGMKVPTISYHLVFTGNPGTGKTTIARMVAKLYYLMGILPKGQFIETDRSGLVAGYLGQTALKTKEVIQKALGGVLFIDEAYTLANGDQDSYGKEAIETLLKAMEDHRDELVVIVAGYNELMREFINSNPGLRSRFNKYFTFADYNGDEMLQIFKHFCEKNEYQLHEQSDEALRAALEMRYEKRNERFGNARFVRNVFEQALQHQANRLVLEEEITEEKLKLLVLEDILPVIMSKNV